MGRCSFSSDDIVIKSPNDKKLYRLITLENGLTALLLHDPDIYPQPGHTLKGGAFQTKKAAAAMFVGMGSFSDPPEAQGLAHFLEHMLFMGSTKFPDENEYDSYLSKHGGSSNACTREENTSYHFEVKPEFLKGALTRFSQFFVSPLMKSEAMERELQSIDSEFNRVLQNDFCRLEQLQGHTATPGHPFNNFSRGNKRSLDDAREKGINLRQQIMQMYTDYYHGGLMKLVVIGGESLDILEQWVLELFGDVKKGPQVNLEFKAEGPIWNVGKLYRLEAVNDVHILHLAWALPSLHQHYLKCPDYFLSHLLEHEGRGSLYFYLKAKGWATYLNASVNRYSVADVFCMIIYLTDSGLEQIFEIVGSVYQYIKLLRQVSPQEWIFRELQDIGNMSFRFMQDQPQDDYAVKLGGNLLRYSAEHVIYGDYVYETWDKELIEYVLGFFRPENMRIDVISKSSFKLENFQCEPWFGSHYTEEDISPSLMNLWKDPPEVDNSLHLPLKNMFIPGDFSIRSDVCCPDSANISSPRCILDEPLVKIWYKLDSTFKQPRVNAYFRINLKGGYDNVKSYVLTELYIELLEDELNEIVYQANVAGLGTHVNGSNDFMELKVYGFNDKLPALLSKILTVTRNFLPTYDRFEVIRERMERMLKNTNMDPQSHSSYLRRQVLYHKYYDVDEELQVLNSLSVSDMKLFIPELCSQLYIEGFCHGNLVEEEALHLSNIFKTNFTVEPLPIELRHKDHCMCLPPSANLVREACVKNNSETNSVIELYFQIEIESTRLRALAKLFMKIVDEPLYDQLRTKEQLGYVVWCGLREICRVYGFVFCVESSEHNPIYLQGRVDNFINGVDLLLHGLDDDSFENYKDGLIANLLERDETLGHETSRLWEEITNKRYTYDWPKRVAEEVRSLQKEDIINFYKTYLQPSSPKCRRLAIRVWGCNSDLKEAEAPPESIQLIQDLAAFKMSSEFYLG
ncbi:PREDICTED: insulin-degrading enzyme-like [Fragaria vesca subsp. vesca]|uniref:insulin-degrading enzyme-like n=1 Tax=Fragaria vesca subsp. vesca TaxID=101020 RepID=UPI0002C31EB6|nr:PREDICTED: insulin-degrading enzyme-like [Fragaria vesca subsp. vesca]